MSLNLRCLYNNNIDSDVMIMTSNGPNIHAHKVILRQKSTVLDERLTAGVKVLSFTSCDDATVRRAFQHMYDVPIESLHVDSWISLIKFLHSIKADYGNLLNADAIASTCRFDEWYLVSLAHEMNDETVMLRAISRICNRPHGHITRYSTDGESWANIKRSEYESMRNTWLKSPFSKYTLLLVDCCYCKSMPLSLALSTLGEFISRVRLSQFTHEELITISSEFPLFSDIPLLSNIVMSLASRECPQ